MFPIVLLWTCLLFAMRKDVGAGTLKVHDHHGREACDPAARASAGSNREPSHRTIETKHMGMEEIQVIPNKKFQKHETLYQTEHSGLYQVASRPYRRAGSRVIAKLLL